MWVGQVSKLTGMLWLSLSIGLAAIGILLRPSAPAVVEIMPTPTLRGPAVWYSPTATPAPTPVAESGILYTVQDGDSWWTIVESVCDDLGFPKPDSLAAEVSRVHLNLSHNEVWTNDVLHPGDEVGVGCVLP